MSKLYGDVTGKSGWPPNPKKPKAGQMSKEERLQGFLDTVQDVGKELASRDTEIERLKGIVARQIKWNLMTDEQVVLDIKDENSKLRMLITELADALEEEYGSNPGDGHPSNLLQRAREATK